VTVRVAVNGFGRIGRNFLRALHSAEHDIEIVAVNDLVSADANAHLLRYDSTYGRFAGTVEVTDGHLIVDGQKITVTAERDPKALPSSNRPGASPSGQTPRHTSRPEQSESSSPRRLMTPTRPS
jgi:glyceraldehyde 3-phosphate dehydrogenase